MMTCEVLVDDNFHFMDEGERCSAGHFATAEEALAKCREIVRASVASCYKPGMMAEQIYDNYKMTGEDPFVRGLEFSAWDYAKELAAKVATTSVPIVPRKPKSN